MLIQERKFQEKDGSIGYYDAVYNSSNILQTTYFPSSEKLYISFNRGGVYSYLNVTQELYEEFKNAESQGEFFSSRIKKNVKQFPYMKEYTLYPNEIKDLKEIVNENKKETEVKKIILTEKEQYSNIIELLMKGLEFYATEENYFEDKNNKFSKIELDKGNQATFILKQVDKILNNINETEENFNEMGEEYMKKFDDEKKIEKELIEKLKNI